MRKGIVLGLGSFLALSAALLLVNSIVRQAEYQRAVRQKDAELELLSGLLQATAGAGGGGGARAAGGGGVSPLQLFAATGSGAMLAGLGERKE